MVNENEVITIKLDDIIPNRFQPREIFDEESMRELADSIKEHGVIQPIIVRPVDNKYEIIAGERRYKASVMAGKTDIPALVRDKDDKESSILAFIENSQRKNMSPIEEAKTCERLLTTNDMTQEQLAKQLGMSQSTLANKLRLLTLPIEVQDSVLHGEISERHARSLLSIKDTKQQLELLDKIKNEKLTVRELDGVIKNMNEEVANKDGLYDLPGSDEYKENNPQQDTVMDFSKYENPVEPMEQKVEVPPISNPTFDKVASEIEKNIIDPLSQKVQETNEFLSFLNNFDDSKVAESVKTEVPEATVTPVEEAKPEAPQETNEFLTFLNNFDDSKVAESVKPKETPVEEVKVETPQVPVEAPTSPTPVTEDKNEFLDFLNKFDDSKVAENNKIETPAVEEKKEEAPVVSPTPVAAPQVDQSFDDFLKDFNSGITPVPPTVPEDENPDDGTTGGVVNKPVVEETKEEPNDFMKFLNSFDASGVVPADIPEVKEDTMEIPPVHEDFAKKYEAPVSEPVDLGPVEDIATKDTAAETKTTEATMDVNSKYLNPIEEVTPKTEYVENSPNYVDITKPMSYDSVDSIIGELKVVTDKIKKSKYKITTEETNYDDVYTITIKIDKRNFL